MDGCSEGSLCSLQTLPSSWEGIHAPLKGQMLLSELFLGGFQGLQGPEGAPGTSLHAAASQAPFPEQGQVRGMLNSPGELKAGSQPRASPSTQQRQRR